MGHEETGEGVSWVAHYLDDYITLGPPGADTCAANLEAMLATCARLGVPTAPGKFEAPTSSLVFLGFELDTEVMEVRLPPQKLRRILDLVEDWLHKRACKKHDLECLLGHLQHAAIVVRPGRTLVRRLLELLAAFRNRDHWIRLGCAVHSDQQWWSCFMEGWNGVSLISRMAPQRIPLVSDASGSLGCGVFWGPHCFQWQWEGRASDWTIAPKELLLIVCSLAIWGKHSRVECRCDNAAVVAVVNSGKAKDSTLLHLLQCLFFVAAHYSVHIHASHIPGKDNVAADALSRNSLSSFLQVVPDADKDPTPIPRTLLD